MTEEFLILDPAGKVVGVESRVVETYEKLKEDHAKLRSEFSALEREHDRLLKYIHTPMFELFKERESMIERIKFLERGKDERDGGRVS